jgi:hypothetical protein
MMRADHKSFLNCTEQSYRSKYTDMLTCIVAETYRSNRFIELYYLSGEAGISDTIWQISRLSARKLRLVQDLVDTLSSDDSFSKA